MRERSWQGYLRQDGRKGIRNHILVVYTVECASFVAQEIAKGESGAHVIGFPGCYDNDYAIRLMLALATHPNVGGVLCVGLGYVRHSLHQGVSQPVYGEHDTRGNAEGSRRPRRSRPNHGRGRR